MQVSFIAGPPSVLTPGNIEEIIFLWCSMSFLLKFLKIGHLIQKTLGQISNLGLF